MSWFSPLYRGSEMHADRDLAQTGSVQQIRRDSVDGLPLLLSEISEFWFANQEGDNVPDWSQFSPQTHPKLLPHIVFWEIVENSYFARITGETVRFLLPVKLSNRRLHDVLTDDLSSLPAELDQAVASKAPIYADRPNAWSLEDETVHSQTAHLPFRTHDGAINRVLSVMSLTTEPRVDF